MKPVFLTVFLLMEPFRKRRPACHVISWTQHQIDDI